MTRDFHSDEGKLYFTLKSTQIHLRRHENLTFFFLSSLFTRREISSQSLSFGAFKFSRWCAWVEGGDEHTHESGVAGRKAHNYFLSEGKINISVTWQGREWDKVTTKKRRKLCFHHDSPCIIQEHSRWEMANSSDGKSFRLRHISLVAAVWFRLWVEFHFRCQMENF